MRFKKRHHSILLGSVAALALSSAMPSFAQEAEQPEDGTKRLSEITVTATRREASIQDVPIAVTAISQDELNRQGVLDVRSLENLSASFSIQSSQVPSQATSIRIRGVGTTGNNIGLESAVGVFLDGVFLSRPGIALGDLIDLEQLEVLRGPQGTLFGRNTSAGALNITTRKPNLERLDGFANIQAGNLEGYSVQAGFSAPIIQDQLGVRLSGSWRTQEGILSSTADNLDGSDIESGNIDRWSLRGQVLWEPTSDVSIRLIGDYAQTDEQCCDAVILSDPFQPFFAALGPTPSTGLLDPTGGVPVSGFDALDDRISNAEEFDNPIEQWGISGQLDWDLGFANFTYIGAFRDFFADSVQESDFTGLDVFSVGGVTGIPGLSDQPSFDDIQTQTHEARFQGELFDGRLDWLVGGFYSDESIVEQVALTLGDDFDLTFAAVLQGAFAGTPLTGIVGNSPIENVTGVSPSGSFALNQFSQDARSWSIFTHNTFAVTDKFDFTVGLRYVDEQKDATFENFGGQSDACLAIFGVLADPNTDPGVAAVAGAAAGGACFPFAVIPNLPGSGIPALIPTPATFSDDPNEPGVPIEDFEDDELVYTLKASYQATDNVTLYGGFTHGFKAGGFNLDPTAAVNGADPSFLSEEVDSWEFGLKSDFWDGRARVNVALFHSDFSNFQVLEFTGVQFQTFNVDQALSTGVELEAQVQATDQLSLTTALTYADARYPNDCAGADDIINAQTLCGNDLTNAPEFVGIWGATWEDQFSAFGQNLNYFGNVNVRYSTDRRTSTQANFVGTDIPQDFDIQEAFTKVNLRVGFGSEDGLWQIEGFVNNLTDEITRQVTFNLPLRGAGTVQPRGAFIEAPRTYGIVLRTRF